MKPIESIVAATDLSTDARVAALRAGLLAAEFGASLTLLHVVGGSTLDALRRRFAGNRSIEERVLAEARGALQALAAELRGRTGADARTLLRIGSVREEIDAVAARADLLVVGEHGASRLRDRVLGTTAERLLRSSRVPVLVNKRPASHGYRRVLVPVDFSAYSESALRLALRLAPAGGITAFHAFEVPFEGKLRYAGVADDEVHTLRVEARQQALADLGALLARTQADEGRAGRSVRHGSPARAVLEKAAEIDADLVVIGRQGQTPLEDFFLGSVTRHVLGAVACDVAIVVAADAGATGAGTPGS